MINILAVQCDNDTLKIIHIIKIALDIIKLAVPIILIIFCMVDAIKNVTSKDGFDKKLMNKMVTRLLAAIIVFFVPTLTNIVFAMLGEQNIQLSQCWKEANYVDVAADKDTERIIGLIDNLRICLKDNDFVVSKCEGASTNKNSAPNENQKKLIELQESRETEIAKLEKELAEATAAATSASAEEYRLEQNIKQAKEDAKKTTDPILKEKYLNAASTWEKELETKKKTAQDAKNKKDAAQKKLDEFKCVDNWCK
jgi:TATA-binding protein-associated factor